MQNKNYFILSLLFIDIFIIICARYLYYNTYSPIFHTLEVCRFPWCDYNYIPFFILFSIHTHIP